LSHDKLLFGSAKEDVHTLAETTLHGKTNLKYFNWRKVCGKYGVLTNTIKIRIMMEKEKLDRLPNHLKMLKMDNDFDLFKESKCFSCFYDVHISIVCWECSLDSYSCLKHFKLFCLCEIDKRFVLVRYTMNEISTLVEALEREPHKIKAWATRNNGVVSAKAEDTCMHEQDTERAMCKTKNCEEGKSYPSYPGTNER
jgi:histone demethylase JARID1